MKISLSLMSFTGSVNEKIAAAKKVPHDLLHIDYMDDFDLKSTILASKAEGLRIDLHIVSATALETLANLANEDLLKDLDFIFVQVENVEKKNLREIFSFPNVYPAIMVSTDWVEYINYSSKSDAILIMTSTPGISGGKFNEKTYECISMAQKNNPSARIYVDGGVSANNYLKLRDKSIHTVVIGSFLAKSQCPARTHLQLKSNQHIGVTLKSVSDQIRLMPTVYEATLFNVLDVMNTFKSNFVLVLSENGILKGIITDGDIKRYILTKKNIQLNSEITPNEDFFAKFESDSIDDLLTDSKFRHALGCIPLKDENNNINSVVRINKLLEM